MKRPFSFSGTLDDHVKLFPGPLRESYRHAQYVLDSVGKATETGDISALRKTVYYNHALEHSPFDAAVILRKADAMVRESSANAPAAAVATAYVYMAADPNGGYAKLMSDFVEHRNETDAENSRRIRADAGELFSHIREAAHGELGPFVPQALKALDVPELAKVAPARGAGPFVARLLYGPMR